MADKAAAKSGVHRPMCACMALQAASWGLADGLRRHQPWAHAGQHGCLETSSSLSRIAFDCGPLHSICSWPTATHFWYAASWAGVSCAAWALRREMRASVCACLRCSLAKCAESCRVKPPLVRGCTLDASVMCEQQGTNPTIAMHTCSDFGAAKCSVWFVPYLAHLINHLLHLLLINPTHACLCCCKH